MSDLDTLKQDLIDAKTALDTALDAFNQAKSDLESHQDYEPGLSEEVI